MQVKRNHQRATPMIESARNRVLVFLDLGDRQLNGLRRALLPAACCYLRASLFPNLVPNVRNKVTETSDCTAHSTCTCS